MGAPFYALPMDFEWVDIGKVPDYSVVVPGAMPSKNNPEGPSLYCVFIVKRVDE